MKQTKQTKQNKQIKQQLERTHKLKILLIISLCIVSAVLIYFYITTDSEHHTSENEVVTKVPLTSEKLNSETDSVLFTFGIKKEWIKNINPKDKDLKKISEQNKDLLISKEVNIPRDLAIIELNLDLTNYFLSNNLEAEVVENPRTRDLTLNLFNADDKLRKPAGLIKLNINDSIIRNASDVCIVIDSLEAISLEDASEILNSTREFSVFLPLRNDKAEYQSLVTELKTDHLIKFYTGNEDDITADFKDDMTESQMKSKVRSASISFANSAGIILYKLGSNTEFYNNVKDEFRNNNLKVFEDTIFTEFNRGENKINSLIENIKSENSKGKKVIYYSIFFTESEFRDYEKKIPGLKKSGYKFNNFTDTFNKHNKQN